MFSLLQKGKMPLGVKKSNKPKGGSTSSDKSGGDEMTISAPYMVKHHFHVGFNKDTGNFDGLPPAWELLLKGSQIT